MRARSKLVSLAAIILAIAGCKDSTGPGSYVRIGLSNPVSVPMTVMVDGPSFDAATEDLASAAYLGKSYPGVEGDVISFTMSTATASGTGTCTVGPDIVGHATSDPLATYGQVSFVVTGSSVSVDCSAGWL